MSDRSRRWDPAPIGELLPRLVGRANWQRGLRMGRLRTEWDSVVGAAVAARSEPLRLEDGVLTVRADAGPWAAELTLLSSTIARKADEYLGGGGVVREVRVVGGGGIGERPGLR